MNKKRKGLIIAAILLLLLGVFGCVNPDDEKDIVYVYVKDNDDGTDTTDPYVSLLNPFIGVWRAGDEYWQFRTDGIGGKAVTETGPFDDDFSFFVFLESQYYVPTGMTADPKQSLVILESPYDQDFEEYDDTSFLVTRYAFSITDDTATLIPQLGADITWERVSGTPAVLELDNPLIGEWLAVANSSPWSIKYRADGTVKTYHHSAKHQFENGYALRGNKLVIWGNLRFGGLSAMQSKTGVLADIVVKPIDKTCTVQVTEYENSNWVFTYTKVAAALWKEE